MKRTSLILFAAILTWGNLFAQQDPDDPGVPDSLIMTSLTINDPGQRYAYLPVYGVADESLSYFNTPLRLYSSDNAIRIDTVIFDDTLDCWDDTYSEIQPTMSRIFGWYDLGWDSTFCPPVFPCQQRILFFTLGISIDSGAQPQQAVIDTTWDDRGGSVMFGMMDGVTEITPAVQRGLITYDPTGTDDGAPGPSRQFSLSQNYPNPFNARTTIGYFVSEAGPVELGIYNIAGQRVTTLCDGIQGAGEHEVILDAGGLSSGVYFYRLNANGDNETKRMTLIR